MDETASEHAERGKETGVHDRIIACWGCARGGWRMRSRLEDGVIVHYAARRSVVRSAAMVRGTIAMTRKNTGSNFGAGASPKSALRGPVSKY